MTHSPTPWSAAKSEYGFYVQGPYDVKIAFCSGASIHGKDGSYAISKKEVESNANFIITAVNAYDTNQALIRQLVEAIKSEFNDPDTVKSAALQLNALDAARKAGF